MPQVIHLGLPEITCINCVRPIEYTLSRCTSPAILSFNTNIIEKKIRIVVNDDRPEEEIIRLIREMLDEIGVVTTVITATPETRTAGVFRAHLIQGTVGLVCGAALVGLSLSGLALPFAALCILTGLSTMLTLYLGKTSYRETLNTFRQSGFLTMDTLFTISTLITMTLSIAGLFIPWLPVMPAAGLLIFGFRHIGKAIEDSIVRRISSGLSFKDRAAKYVMKKSTRENVVQWERTRSIDLLPGDVIRISPSETLPVDGICLNRQTLVDQSILNGNLEASVSQNTILCAGVRILENETDILVTKCLQDSHLAVLDEKLEQALAGSAPIENTTHKILQYFVPGILMLAAVSAVVTGFLAGPALAFQCAASLMVSACPCTLGFITPLAMNIGMAKALENGVLFTDPAALESAGKISAVIFDLHGTLKLGMPTVAGHRIEPAVDDEKFYAYVAALETRSTHSTGREIFRFVTEEKAYNPEYPVTVEPADQSHHAGISAFINGEHCLLGNRNFMRVNGIVPPVAASDSAEQGDRIYLAINGLPAGSFLMRDPFREHAISVVDALQRMGKEVYICTGSDEVTAQQAAHSLNIRPENVFSGCDADTKSNHVGMLQQRHGRVAMIGDAGNDSLAIVRSDFGMGYFSSAGVTPTHDRAGAVAHGPSLLPVIAAFAISQQTIGSIKQNLMISFIYNAVTALIASGALLAIGVSITPPLGAALMVAQMLILLANQYRIRHQNPVPAIRRANTAAQADSTLTYRRFHHHRLINPYEVSSNAAELGLGCPGKDMDSCPTRLSLPTHGDCPLDAEFDIIDHRNHFTV